MTMSIMIQGTGTNVGKSVLVAGLARALRHRGLTVMPFKPQNMSNNAAVTTDGGEIGRAQALQALAAHQPAHTDMNPVLLKPESSKGSQVVVHGKRLTTVAAKDYSQLKPTLMLKVMESFERLANQCDIVLVEGAGSPAEINLRASDIANMGFASEARVPVILAGDIDRGGVIAQLVGTSQILPPSDRELIKGFIINKFRGDVSLFSDGYEAIKSKTGWEGLGIAPWFENVNQLPAEDSMDIHSKFDGSFKIAVPKLARIANFDDLDPLKIEPNVSLTIVEPGNAIPGDTDLVILPGTKSTIADLEFLRTQGWDIDIFAHVRRGGRVLGICGGFQMLGTSITDPDGIEGPAGSVNGLGLLDVQTRMTPTKTTKEVSGHVIASNVPVKGYEIHIGETVGPDCSRPWLVVDQKKLGATSPCGRIQGSYLHGIFAGDAFRRDYLGNFAVETSSKSYHLRIDETLDALAEHLEKHLNINRMLDISKSGL